MGPASVDAPVYKAAVSIGWNPTYTGDEAVKHKMIEPYLLHEFDTDFYGEALRLVVCGYIRPEAKFEGEQWLSELKAAIAQDVRVTEASLDQEPFQLSASDETFLKHDLYSTSS